MTIGKQQNSQIAIPVYQVLVLGSTRSFNMWTDIAMSNTQCIANVIQVITTS